MGLFHKHLEIPSADQALPGREAQMPVPPAHYVNGHPLAPPYPERMAITTFAMGCFWGAEKLFWEQEGVYVTAVGYAGGHTPNPMYDEVCSGLTGHTEAVRVVFDPMVVPFERLLELFWENHDPTQGMRQGNDVGTQYRSGIYTSSEEQLMLARASKDAFQQNLVENGYGKITTEIMPAPVFYFAEPYHQQYLARVPGGYCGIAGTGVCYQKPVTHVDS